MAKSEADDSAMFKKMTDRLRRGRGTTSPEAKDEFLVGGAYRRHRPEDEGRFTALACAAFPDFADRMTCFGADWLGRQFATDRARVVSGEPLVLMLEPGTGQALEIPSGVDGFHEQVLVEQSDAAVASGFFEQWLASGGARPGYDQCIGYKVPLFLGGRDDTTNLVVSDFDVYWSMSAQIIAKVRGLPVGTPVRAVTIE